MLSDFTNTFGSNVFLLRKQRGFQDEITFAIPGGTAPEVLKSLDKVLDGTPKERVSDVISSTCIEPPRALPPEQFVLGMGPLRSRLLDSGGE